MDVKEQITKAVERITKDEKLKEQFRKEPVKALAVRFSVPEWIVREWLSDYGREKAEEMLAAAGKEPKITVRANTTKCTAEELREMLTREQVRVEKGRGCHRPGRDERILFGGVITCGECGENYSHIQPHNKKRSGGTAKWKCKNYIYQNRLSCAGGFITDEQVKEVCVSAINRIIQDKKQMRPPAEAEEQVSAEYRKVQRRLEEAKTRRKQTGAGKIPDGADMAPEGIDADQAEQAADGSDTMALIYERAQERYLTLEIRDASFRTEEMLEILSGREELTEFDRELYKKLVKKIVIYKDNTAETVFLNGSSIKTGYR